MIDCPECGFEWEPWIQLVLPKKTSVYLVGESSRQRLVVDENGSRIVDSEEEE